MYKSHTYLQFFNNDLDKMKKAETVIRPLLNV
jgi:hypothetical protein